MIPLYRLNKNDFFRFQSKSYKIIDFLFEEEFDNRIEEWVLNNYVQAVCIQTGKIKNFPENLIVKYLTPPK